MPIGERDNFRLNGVVYSITEEERTTYNRPYDVVRVAHAVLAPTKHHAAIINIIKQDKHVELNGNRKFSLPRTMSIATPYALSVIATPGSVLAIPNIEDLEQYVAETATSLHTLRIGMCALALELLCRQNSGIYADSKEVISGAYAID